MDKKRIFRWEPIVEEADKLFEYLLHNYDNMLDGEEKVKHFDILSGDYFLIGEAYEIKEKYCNEIQCELVPWIRAESKTRDLFKIENWRPFRDPELVTDMFLGYRKFFYFKHYIFQLTMSWHCDNDTYVCKYCKKEDYGRHFGVALYSQRDLKYDKLEILDILPILDDIFYPELLWFEKE
jgi:hypothetical protein